MHTLNYIHLLFWGGIFFNLYNAIQPKDSAKQAKKPPGVFVETGFPCVSLGGGGSVVTSRGVVSLAVPRMSWIYPPLCVSRRCNSLARAIETRFLKTSGCFFRILFSHLFLSKIL